MELAEGKVVFTNQTNRTVRIPAGTIVSTSTGDAVDFRILEEIEIAGPVGTQAEVEIEATEPGILGNCTQHQDHYSGGPLAHPSAGNQSGGHVGGRQCPRALGQAGGIRTGC